MEQTQESGARASSERGVDEVDRARAQEYSLLAILLSRSPDTEMIGRLASLTGDATPLGTAHAALGEAAARTDVTRAGREFFGLFTGLGQGELQPYASHYLTGSLYGRPLARLRETLRRLGIERVAGHSEPEDHVAVLCEVMAGLVDGQISGPDGVDRAFFDEHLAPWIVRFFTDLEQAKSSISTAAWGLLAEFSWALKRSPLLSRLEYLTKGRLPSVGRNLVARYRRITMRAFIVACAVAVIIAVGGAAILDNFVQEPASAAFAEPNVRI